MESVIFWRLESGIPEVGIRNTWGWNPEYLRLESGILEWSGLPYIERIFNTVEFSVPFDRFIDLCYQHKFNRYIELCNRCNELGYHTRITVLVIGPLGLDHNKFVNGLKVIGLTTSKAKAIAKYVSASAQIGSYLCWSSRMRKWMLLHVN